MFYGTRVRRLQAVSYNLESGVQRFCCEEVRLLLPASLNQQQQRFSGAAAAAKAAGSEETSSNL